MLKQVYGLFCGGPGSRLARCVEAGGTECSIVLGESAVSLWCWYSSLSVMATDINLSPCSWC